MSRPRVVWVVDSNDPSGTARMALLRAARLRPGFRCTVVGLRRAPVGPPPGSPFREVVDARSAAGRVRFARADVAVTTSERTLRWALLARGFGTRIVHVVHQDPQDLVLAERFMADVAQVDRLLLPWLPWGEHTAARFGLEAPQVGVHRDFLEPGAAPLATVAAPVALFVGRMRRGSGALELARGFALVADDLPRWSVRFVGWGEQRPLVNRVAEEHHLGARMVTLGPSYDVSGDLLESSLCVRPGTTESGGLWVREALAHGVPVVGSAAVPAVADLVRHRSNGLRLERTDPDEVAEALLEVARDTDLRTALAEGAAASDSAGVPDATTLLAGLGVGPRDPVARPLG